MLFAGVAVAVNFLSSNPAPAAAKTRGPQLEMPKMPPTPPRDAPAAALGRPASRPAAAAPKDVTPPPPKVVDVTPTVGTLRIDSDVPGAQVFIDHKYIGVTPITHDVDPGTHRLNLSAEGYDGIGEDLDVAVGVRDISIKFKDVKLDLKIDVVHKHAMGSCKGQLIASPQGLRYDTSNTGDAFTAAFADIDTFEIDYLAKNLKLKLKSGKTYNFTDPDGNADRLFTFQKEVEKARARIKKG